MKRAANFASTVFSSIFFSHFIFSKNNLALGYAFVRGSQLTDIKSPPLEERRRCVLK
jgi:hypothetical protein